MKKFLFFVSLSVFISGMARAQSKSVIGVQKYKEYMQIIKECFPEDTLIYNHSFFSEDTLVYGQSSISGIMSTGIEATVIWSTLAITLYYELYWKSPVDFNTRVITLSADGTFSLNTTAFKRTNGKYVGASGATVYISGEELMVYRGIEDFLINGNCNVKPLKSN